MAHVRNGGGNGGNRGGNGGAAQMRLRRRARARNLRVVRALLTACQQGRQAAVATILNLNVTAVSNTNGLADRVLRCLLQTCTTSGATALLLASEHGHDSIVELLLQHQNALDINAALNTGGTSLYVAAQNGHGAVVTELLHHGADTEIAMPSGATPLFAAASHGYTDIVTTLCVAGASKEATVNNGATPFFIACERGHVAAARALLTHGASTDCALPGDGTTPAMMAATAGKVETLDFLREVGVDFNTQNNNGITALYCAARNGKANAVTFLLGCEGVDNSLVSVRGCTALYAAVENGHVDVADLLVASPGGDTLVNQATDSGCTPAFVAAQNGHTAVVRRLREEHGADLSLGMQNGAQPLYVACQNGHEDTVDYLLSCEDVDAMAPNAAGATPLYIAAEKGHAAIVERLLADERVHASVATDDGCTPFLIACVHGWTEVVRVFVAHDLADTQMRFSNVCGLGHAIYNGHVNTATVLLQDGHFTADVVYENGGAPLLFLAVSRGHFAAFRLLAEHGGDVHATHNNWSLLEMAAYHSFTCIVDALVEEYHVLEDMSAADIQHLAMVCLNSAHDAGLLRVAQLLGDRALLTEDTLFAVAFYPVSAERVTSLVTSWQCQGLAQALPRVDAAVDADNLPQLIMDVQPSLYHLEERLDALRARVEQGVQQAEPARVDRLE